MTKAQEVVILPVMSTFCNSNFITCHHPLNLELTIFWLPQIIYQYIKVCMVNQFLKVLNCKTLIFFFFVVILVQIQLLVNMEVEYSAQQISNRQEPILIQFSITQAQIWYSAQTNVANAVHSEFVWIIIFKRNQLMVYNLICGSLSINPVYFFIIFLVLVV